MLSSGSKHDWEVCFQPASKPWNDIPALSDQNRGRQGFLGNGNSPKKRQFYVKQYPDKVQVENCFVYTSAEMKMDKIREKIRRKFNGKQTKWQVMM